MCLVICYCFARSSVFDEQAEELCRVVLRVKLRIELRIELKNAQRKAPKIKLLL